MGSGSELELALPVARLDPKAATIDLGASGPPLKLAFDKLLSEALDGVTAKAKRVTTTVADEHSIPVQSRGKLMLVQVTPRSVLRR